MADERDWTLFRGATGGTVVEGPPLRGAEVIGVVPRSSREAAEAELRKIKDEASRVVAGACIQSWSDDIRALAAAEAERDSARLCNDEANRQLERLREATAELMVEAQRLADQAPRHGNVTDGPLLATLDAIQKCRAALSPREDA